MNAPILWIFLPGGIAGVLFFLRRWERATITIGILVAVVLSWLAWQLPIGQSITLLPFSNLAPLRIADTLQVLGRRFVLTDDIRPILVMIYLGVALWFGGAFVAQAGRMFVPLGLGIAALLTASLAVEPFLYAALLIEMAVLVSIPMVSTPGRPTRRGVLRFLTLQTLGMPCILFAGWLLGGVEANPADTDLVLRVSILMGLGFSFFMAIFPFHTWIPMLAEDAHPYAAAFVFFVLPGMVSLFGLSFLTNYAWLRSAPVVFVALRSVGALMVVTGGVWAAFQRHLGRMLGYAAIIEIGLSLLALSVVFGAPPTPETTAGGINTSLLGIFFAQLLPRGIGLAVWALALSILQSRSPDLRFRTLQGLARQMPVAAASLVLAQFALAGFPLLAGFPVRLALWGTLAQQSLPVALLALAGAGGLLAGGLRTLAVLTMECGDANPRIGDANPRTGDADQSTGDQEWRVSENWSQIALLSFGWIMLFLIGLLPNWFFPYLANMAQRIY